MSQRGDKAMKDSIEFFVARMGLVDFLFTVAEICDEKACADWLDRPHAKKWERAATKVSNLATKIDEPSVL